MPMGTSIFLLFESIIFPVAKWENDNETKDDSFTFLLAKWICCNWQDYSLKKRGGGDYRSKYSWIEMQENVLDQAAKMKST